MPSVKWQRAGNERESRRTEKKKKKVLTGGRKGKKFAGQVRETNRRRERERRVEEKVNESRKDKSMLG